MVMKRVVFVSPSKLGHNLMGVILKSFAKKYSLLCFEDPESALSHAYQRPIDVLVADKRVLTTKTMPTFEHLSNHKSFLDCKTVLLHERGALLNQKYLQNLSFDASLTKPFLTEEITQTLLNLCGEAV